jgi:hypothetical protein
MSLASEPWLPKLDDAVSVEVLLVDAEVGGGRVEKQIGGITAGNRIGTILLVP